VDPEKRIAFLEEVVKFQLEHHLEEEKRQALWIARLRQQLGQWSYLAVRAAITPNPWAKTWKYMAKYWRNSYLLEKNHYKIYEKRYADALEGIAVKLERVADRQGPGGLCQTEHEREILKMLAGEIRGGRWQ
jgi:hypothetical protein